MIVILYLNEPDLLSQRGLRYQEKYVKGFIINNNGDSLRGYIRAFDKNRYTKRAYYKTLLRSGYQEHNYTPYDIAKFGNSSGSVRYRSASVPLTTGTELVFVRELIDGDFDMLVYQQNEEEHILLRTSDNVITDLTYDTENINKSSLVRRFSDAEFRSRLNKVFSDYPDLLSEIPKIIPTRKSIAGLITDYHYLTKKSFRIYGVPDFAFNAGITTGVTADQMNLKIFNKPFSTGYSLSPYAGLIIAFGSMSKKIDLFAESTVSQKSFHYSGSADISGGELFRETFINTLCVTNKLGLTYGEKKKRLTPLFSAGGTASFFLSPQYDNYYDVTNYEDNTVISELDHVKMNSSAYYGLFLRPGARYRINSKNSVSLNIEYSYLFSKGSERISMAGFALIYQFRIK